ncbi:MAG: hypothetical protein ACREJ2_07195, partial [Planctomycetota bacterium]
MAHRAGGVLDEESCALHYGQPVEELLALRRTAVVALRNDFGLLEITGADALDFLQRLTTNDLKALAPGTGHANLFLNAKGRILAEFRLFRLPVAAASAAPPAPPAAPPAGKPAGS